MLKARLDAAQEHERRLLMEAASNAMLVVDADGTIALANAAAERFLGFAPGTLAGQSADVLQCAEISAAGTPAAANDDRDPVGLIASQGARTVRRLDGSTIPVLVGSRFIPALDGPLRLITLGNAAQRRTESPRGAVTAPALEHERIGRWRFDLQSGEFRCSAHCRQIVNAGRERLTLEALLASFGPLDRTRIAQLVERATADGTPFCDEARVVRPDGTEHAIVHGASVERSATDGSIVALLGFVLDITENFNATHERERLNEYISVSNHANRIGIWELDLTTHQSVWDRNMYSLYGVADTTTPPTFALWADRLHPHDRERAISEVKTDIADGAPSDSEFRIVWPNGEVHNIRSLATIVRDDAGAPARIIGTDWDVTEIRSLGEALREEKDALTSSEARYRALTEAMPQMVWVIDGGGQFEYVNWRWLAYTGMTLERSSAAGIGTVIEPSDAAVINAYRSATPPTEFECEARLRRSEGSFRWHLVRGVPFHDASGAEGKWMITATDIEERKNSERMLAETVAELEHRAHHDPMTNLPNRMLLIDRLAQALLQAQRTSDRIAVLYVDLDRFKAINDSLGHAAGDCVLSKTAARIVGTLRAGDTASRVGGDEFIVVCNVGDDESDVVRIATRLLAAVTEPIDVRGERVVVEASIGISVYPGDGGEADALIRKADAAMYSAKQNGRNSFRRYSSEVQSIVAAASFEAELRHAITAGEFVVYYQPILNLMTGRSNAAEALVRWQHPVRGLLAPGEFIAFAEERGLVAQIGEAVLDSACEMLQRLSNAGHTDVSIAVNVSAHQFSKPGFVDSIVAALASHNTEARRLTVEITESAVMGNTRATLATLAELRAAGINLSMDDFGTGYSSLAYIKRFPITTLKIDRSFVIDVAHDPTDQAIAKTIITLAHSLGMSVIAEGVETVEQLAQLRSFGVDSIQGYYLSRPVSADDYLRFVAAFNPAGDAAENVNAGWCLRR